MGSRLTTAGYWREWPARTRPTPHPKQCAGVDHGGCRTGNRHGNDDASKAKEHAVTLRCDFPYVFGGRERQPLRRGHNAVEWTRSLDTKNKRVIYEVTEGYQVNKDPAWLGQKRLLIGWKDDKITQTNEIIVDNPPFKENR
jgi:hypothetical protein